MSGLVSEGLKRSRSMIKPSALRSSHRLEMLFNFHGALREVGAGPMSCRELNKIWC